MQSKQLMQPHRSNWVKGQQMFLHASIMVKLNVAVRVFYFGGEEKQNKWVYSAHSRFLGEMINEFCVNSSVFMPLNHLQIPGIRQFSNKQQCQIYCSARHKSNNKAPNIQLSGICGGKNQQPATLFENIPYQKHKSQLNLLIPFEKQNAHGYGNDLMVFFFFVWIYHLWKYHNSQRIFSAKSIAH